MQEPGWPNLPRPVNWHRSERFGNMPVCGRKFCSCCGRWRMLMDFGASGRSDRGIPLRFASRCITCERVLKRIRGGYKGPRKLGRASREVRRERWKEQQRRRRQDPQFLEQLQEYQRIWKEGRRRAAGVVPRDFLRNGSRNKGAYGKADAVDAGPFLEWLDAWQRKQAEARGSDGDGDRPVAGLDELADLAGCSARTFSRARAEGRLSLSIIDRVLVRASDEMIETLYPESEYPEIYRFEEAS